MTHATQDQLRITESTHSQAPLPLNGSSEGGSRSLLSLSDSDLHAALAYLDWDLASAQTDELTHGLHSYPAKFIPQLPARLINMLSEPGDLVVDPFSGGGTTGVEALRLERRFVGLDANPVGVLLGNVKTTTLTTHDWSMLNAFTATLNTDRGRASRETSSHVPPIPNIEKWYSPSIVTVLAGIRALIEEYLPVGAARGLALAAFANTAARVSFQDSETRYVSKPRVIDPQEPLLRFVSELGRMASRVRMLETMPDNSEVRFALGDARRREHFGVVDGAVGLVVTSPPYPNAYDYHLYHRFRLFWLGADPSALRRVEIGSHLTHQTQGDPAGSYEADMTSVLANLHDLLAGGRYCAMVVGDGIYAGEPYRTADRLSEIATTAGWTALPTITRTLPQLRRSVTSAGRRLRTEEILLLKKLAASLRVRPIEPSYERFPYEADLGRRELHALTGIEPASDGVLEVPPHEIEAVVSNFSSAAFWHGLKVDSDDVLTPTRQRLLEDPSPGRRKQSTYVTHGLHRYKGKFYPQLAKALLNLSELDSRDTLALDPFGGSGTMMLESVLNGRDAVSIDCSPLATAVAQTKIDVLAVGPHELAQASFRLLGGLPTSGAPAITNWAPFTPSTHEELSSWFAPRILVKLGALLEAVRAVEDQRLVAFYEVLVSDLIREVSHQDPRDLRIRRRAVPLDDAPVMELFRTRVEAAVAKVMAFHAIGANAPPRLGTGYAVLGDSAGGDAFGVLEPLGRSIDAVVSSPPYATALPYLDTDRLSLAAVFGYCKTARKELEKSLIGSRETSKSEQRVTDALIAEGLDRYLPDSTTRFLQQLLESTTSDASAGFRKRQLPTVLTRYFLGVSAVMKQLIPRLRCGANLWFVLGDSRTEVGGKRWIIPTVDEFQSIAKSSGLEFVEKIPITVTREDVIHARHTITENAIVHLRAPA